MNRSWKTSTAGWLGLIGIAATVAAKLADGETLGLEDIMLLVSVASTGVGLIKAKDKDKAGLEHQKPGEVVVVKAEEKK